MIKDRKTFQIDSFLGMDFTTSPLKVDYRRACSGYNFISEYGTIKKRNGWIELIKFTDKPIKGIYNYKRGTDDFLIVRAGDKIYQLENDFETYTTLMTLAEATNERVMFYPYEDKLIITGIGKLLIFYHDGTNYVLEDLKNEAYIPTTTISIDDIYVADSVRASHERPNLLTGWRKNSLLGKTGAGAWKLDAAAITNGSDVELYIDVETLVGSDIITTRYTTSGYSIVNGLDEQVGGISFKTVDETGENVEFIISLTIDTTPPIEGGDNIIVTFKAAEQTALLAELENNRMGVIYGVNGQNNQLFLSNGAKEFYSAAFDYTYFPDDQITTIGNPKNPIVGYARISDSSLLIYKDNLINESRMYFRSMTLETDSESLLAQYRMYDRAVDVNIGCDAPMSIENLTGDHLFLSNTGVYAVTLGDNVSVEQRHVRERSTRINKHLMTKTINDAKATVFDNRYYLAVDGTVYVADARFRTAADMDDTFDYEWFYFENVPVNTWFVMDNELYFGTEEGRICIFDENYSDRTLIRASEGDVTITMDNLNYYLVHNIDIPVKENDEIYATIFEILIPYTDISIAGQLITASYDVEAILENGMEIYAAFESGYQIYYISDLDGATFKVKNGSGTYVTPIQTDILIDLSEEKLYTTNVDDEGLKFQVKRNEDGDALEVIGSETEPITFKIVIHEPVKMVWYSSIFDLGSNMFAKTLLAMTVSADASTTGAINFGFDTRNISSNIQSLNFKVFDFDDIDFTNFTFLTAIASSYTKRIKEKDFNYIIFKIGSQTPSSAVISNLSVMYKVNAMNRGIR